MFKFEIFAGLHTASGDCSPATVQRNCNHLRRLADAMLPGYTWQDVTGRWDCRNEASVILIIIGDAGLHQAVRNLAGQYKELAEQESVMITKQEIDADFV